ncbi:MAG: hypothetical protein H0W07_00160 [Chloroflexi bacterium]|nr:hypothetical protein [Chloroflexota bacterium]
MTLPVRQVHRLGQTRSGRVRAARITDLAALGDLSRLSHGAHATDPGAEQNGTRQDDERVRSLGLPFSSGQIRVFSLFRMPLGGFGAHDQLYVYEDDRRLAGLLRAERDGRDEWTIVELDAVDDGTAGDIRFRLVHHLLRDASKRGAARFHVACADIGGNVDLFMQAGFARYGEEEILFRPADRPLPPPLDDRTAADARIRPTRSLDALPLARLYAAATPQPVVRLEAYRLPDWERQGSQWRIPRSALTPILRFADVESYAQERDVASGPELAAFLQLGIAKEDQPHYLRVITRPDHDPSPLIDYGLGLVGERSTRGAGRELASTFTAGLIGGHSREPAVVSAVRTYESPLDRRLEEAAFEPIATVSLLLKETLVRVAEPAMVPATTR